MKKILSVTIAVVLSINMVLPTLAANILFGETGNKKFVATWESIKYSITYDLDGGDLPSGRSNPDTYTTESDTITLINPEKDGYDFVGWTEEGSSTLRQSVTIPKGSTENRVFHAHFEEAGAKYAVKFNSMGGTCDVKSKQVTYGKAYGDLPEPVYKGYSFGGWYTDIEGGGDHITSETSVTKQKNHTLYAYWISGGYTISFDANGGETPINSKTVADGMTYGELPAPTRNGYTFSGWYTDKTAGSLVTSNTAVNITKDQTLYAHWIEKKMKVSFDANGGYHSGFSISVTYNEQYPKLPTPEYKGHTFCGWYTEKVGGKKISEDSIVTLTEDHTLYAHWDMTGYTVHFNATGGTSNPSSKTVRYGETYGSLPTPTKLGYIFDGWYEDETSAYWPITSETTVTKNADHTIYAHWISNTVVYFDADDGIIDTDCKYVDYGKTYNALPTPTKEGWIFDGWYTARNGGEKVTPSTKVTKYENHTLYAHWTGDYYEVTFNGNGASIYVSEEYRFVKNGIPWGECWESRMGEKKALPKAYWVGHVFTGWYTEKEGGELITDDTIVNILGPTTLYAHWDTNTYVISFDTCKSDISNPSSKTVTYGTKYGVLPELKSIGWRFLGWSYRKNDDRMMVDSNTVVISTYDHTLYAIWERIQNNLTFDANGGSYSVSWSQWTITPGVPYNHGFDDECNFPVPTRPGYTFTGWYTERNGGARITERTTVITETDQTLYAHWVVAK